MSGRKLVTEEELLSILNKELSDWGEGENCRIKSVDRMKETDPSGCNWGEANLRCSGVPVSFCRDVFVRIVAEAMTKYNLK